MVEPRAQVPQQPGLRAGMRAQTLAPRSRLLPAALCCPPRDALRPCSDLCPSCPGLSRLGLHPAASSGATQADDVWLLPGAPTPASLALRGSQLVPTTCPHDARQPLRGAGGLQSAPLRTWPGLAGGQQQLAWLLPSRDAHMIFRSSRRTVPWSFYPQASPALSEILSLAVSFLSGRVKIES